MFSAEYVHKIYQPIKFVDGEVENFSSYGPIPVEKPQEQIFNDLDKIISFVMMTKEEQKEIDSPKLKTQSKQLLDLHNKLSTVIKNMD